MNSRLARINVELFDEIKRIAEKNKIKFIEASREIALATKKQMNKKINVTEEIKF